MLQTDRAWTLAAECCGSKTSWGVDGDMGNEIVGVP
jgi:hypothetical protein